MITSAHSATPSVAVTLALNTSSAEWSEQARVAFSAATDFSAVNIFAPNSLPADYAAQQTLSFLICHADAIFCLPSKTAAGELTAAVSQMATLRSDQRTAASSHFE
jgi:hypothetical protein